MLAQKKLKLENHKDENSSKTATLHDTNDTLTRKTGPKARKLVSSCRSETTVLLHHVLQRRFCCTTVWQFVMCVCVCVCVCMCVCSILLQRYFPFSSPSTYITPSFPSFASHLFCEPQHDSRVLIRKQNQTLQVLLK